MTNATKATTNCENDRLRDVIIDEGLLLFVAEDAQRAG
jgi:hypothetical protein